MTARTRRMVLERPGQLREGDIFEGRTFTGKLVVRRPERVGNIHETGPTSHFYLHETGEISDMARMPTPSDDWEPEFTGEAVRFRHRPTGQLYSIGQPVGDDRVRTLAAELDELRARLRRTETESERRRFAWLREKEIRKQEAREASKVRSKLEALESMLDTSTDYIISRSGVQWHAEGSRVCPGPSKAVDLDEVVDAVRKVLRKKIR